MAAPLSINIDISWSLTVFYHKAGLVVVLHHDVSVSAGAGSTHGRSWGCERVVIGTVREGLEQTSSVTSGFIGVCGRTSDGAEFVELLLAKHATTCTAADVAATTDSVCSASCVVRFRKNVLIDGTFAHTAANLASLSFLCLRFSAPLAPVCRCLSMT